MRLESFALLVVLTAACQAESEEAAWWLGTGEPSPTGKADGTSPLTIFFVDEQPKMRRILDEDLGSVAATSTGILNLDGRGFGDGVVLLFDGELHRWDGSVEHHALAIEPWWIPGEAGAANEGGFLRIDFQDRRSIHVFEQEGSPFGTTAGIFEGDVLATDERTLSELADAGELPRFRDLMIRPARFTERPPNYLRGQKVFIRPNVALTQLLPEGGCIGEDVVDRTTTQTELFPEVAVTGFTPGTEVTVELRYIEPRYTTESIRETAWDFISAVFSGGLEERVLTETVTVPGSGGPVTVSMPSVLVKSPPPASDLYPVEIEVQAYEAARAGAFADPARHRVEVVREATEVMVDHFELCPLDDVACHELRDRYEPDNVIAHRNVIEWKAEQDGLYDTVTRPIGECAGGDRVSGAFSDACTIYRESNDRELSGRVGAELNFELNVNGQAGGKASWAGGIPGVASAKLQAAFEAGFGLETDLTASFESSRVWRNRNSLDVLYDPTEAQVQWWRVATPRLRFLELADFDACGQRRSSNEVFLIDLRQSRLVLACEEVPSFESSCHAVEPTNEAVAACNTVLIDPESDEGRMCLE